MKNAEDTAEVMKGQKEERLNVSELMLRLDNIVDSVSRVDDSKFDRLTFDHFEQDMENKMQMLNMTHSLTEQSLTSSVDFMLNELPLQVRNQINEVLTGIFKPL